MARSPEVTLTNEGPEEWNGDLLVLMLDQNYHMAFQLSDKITVGSGVYHLPNIDSTWIHTTNYNLS